MVEPWLRFHIPLIDPDRQISRIRLSDKTSRALLRATPSAAFEHSSELIGCPISRFLTTSCVYLELRSLPSTGITRLQRYCEPLRHPRAPGLSLAGVQLVSTDHPSSDKTFVSLNKSFFTLCKRDRSIDGVKRLGAKTWDESGQTYPAEG